MCYNRSMEKSESIQLSIRLDPKVLDAIEELRKPVFRSRNNMIQYMLIEYIRTHGYPDFLVEED